MVENTFDYQKYEEQALRKMVRNRIDISAPYYKKIIKKS